MTDKNKNRRAFAMQNDTGQLPFGNSPKSVSPYFGTGAVNNECTESIAHARAATRSLSKF